MTDIYTIQELTSDQKDQIKATIPYLEASGEAVTATFYQKMLLTNADVRPFFNKAHQITKQQPKILAFALLNYAKNIDDLTPLTGFVKQIVVKHTGLQVKAEHYPIVGENLLATMLELLGPEVATPKLLDAWAVAYGNLAKILIDAEKEIYQKNDWDGFKDFEVSKIVSECEDVKSVYLKPTDPALKIQIPTRGQYLGIRWKVGEEETTREYSISQFPTLEDNQYRISVKRDRNAGVISNYVHDELKVGDTVRVCAPNGNFVYKQASTAPVLLLAGGVGITPLVSIAEGALANGREVTLLYSNTTIESRPFTQWLQDLKDTYQEKFTLKEYISKKTTTEKVINGGEIFYNRLTSGDIPDTTKYDTYVLGPNGYLDMVFQTLEERGVSKSDVSTEAFGVYRP